MMQKHLKAQQVRNVAAGFLGASPIQDLIAFLELNRADLAMIADHVGRNDASRIIGELLAAARSVEPDHEVMLGALRQLRDLLASAGYAGCLETMLNWAGARLDEFLFRLTNWEKISCPAESVE